jgi:hypothetical protein
MPVPRRTTPRTTPTIRRILPNNSNQQHQKHLRLSNEFQRELLEEEEDDAGGAECERKYGPVGEGFEEEGAEVMLEQEEKLRVLRLYYK